MSFCEVIIQNFIKLVSFRDLVITIAGISIIVKLIKSSHRTIQIRTFSLGTGVVPFGLNKNNQVFFILVLGLTIFD